MPIYLYVCVLLFLKVGFNVLNCLQKLEPSSDSLFFCLCLNFCALLRRRGRGVLLFIGLHKTCLPSLLLVCYFIQYVFSSREFCWEETRYYYSTMAPRSQKTKKISELARLRAEVKALELEVDRERRINHMLRSSKTEAEVQIRRILCDPLMRFERHDDHWILYKGSISLIILSIF